jgi:peroxiredoxin
MPQTLMPDTQAPALTVALVGGGTWDLSQQSPRNFTMIVVYRGYHCPVCKAYLQKLNALTGMATDAGVDVLAVSMDDADRATKTKAEWALDNLTLGYGLTSADASAWGLYQSDAIKDAEATRFAEPGLFWVRPDGRLYLISVANMPWARPDVEFLLSKVDFAMANSYPARGSAAD